jgi:hypothetical protein
VASYVGLVTAPYDYERATYNRVKARLDERPESEPSRPYPCGWPSGVSAVAAQRSRLTRPTSQPSPGLAGGRSLRAPDHCGTMAP